MNSAIIKYLSLVLFLLISSNAFAQWTRISGYGGDACAENLATVQAGDPTTTYACLNDPPSLYRYNDGIYTCPTAGHVFDPNGGTCAAPTPTNASCTNTATYTNGCTPQQCVAGQYFQAGPLSTSCFSTAGGCPTTNCSTNPCGVGSLGINIGGINSCYYQGSAYPAPAGAAPVTASSQTAPLPVQQVQQPDPNNSSSTQTTNTSSTTSQTTVNNNTTNNTTTTTTVNTTTNNVTGGTTTTTTVTTVNNTTGEVTETVSTEYGTADDGQGDGSGTASNQCSQNPQCDGDAVQCAQLVQMFYIMCYDQLGSGQVSQLNDCNTAFSCEGDPIECERARLERENYCSLAQYSTGSAESAFQEAGLQSVDELAVGSAWDETQVTDVGPQLDGLLDGVAGAASNNISDCPAPFTIDIGSLGSFQIAFDAVCDYAEMLRPFLLVLAMFLSSRNVYLAIRGV